MKENLLSPLQKRILSIAITFASLIAIFAFIGIALTNLGEFLKFYSKIIWPLIIASMLAIVLRPIIEYCKRRFKLSRAASTISLYILLLLFISLILFLTIPLLVDQLLDLIDYIPKLASQILGFFEGKFPKAVANLKVKLKDLALFKDPNAFLATFNSYFPTVLQVGNNILGLIAWITGLAVTPIYLFYILRTKSSFIEGIEKQLSFMKTTWRNDLIFLLNQYVQILEAFFRGQLLIALMMGVLFAIGFSLIGLEFGLILGISIGFLNIIPYLGTIIGLTTVIPIAFFQEDGSWVLAVLTLGVFILVEFISGYFLTPKIMNKKTGLHPMTIIISLFFWGTTFHGILGMILAIPLTASIVATWYLVKKKYLSMPATE